MKIAILGSAPSSVDIAPFKDASYQQYMGGKVQAVAGFADHVVFKDLRLCARCEDHTCVAMCSGQAITLDSNGLPRFEREKCAHCGACVWNCGASADGARSIERERRSGKSVIKIPRGFLFLRARCAGGRA